MSLTIKNLKELQFQLQQLLKVQEDCWVNNTDSLQVSYVDNSHLVIATTQNEKAYEK